MVINTFGEKGRIKTGGQIAVYCQFQKKKKKRKNSSSITERESAVQY